MATVGINIFKHHKRKDGTYNVKIRIIHRGEKKYIDTPHFVFAKQLNSKFEIKDPMVGRLINETLADYRKTISELGEKLELFNAESLKNYLIEKGPTFDIFNNF